MRKASVNIVWFKRDLRVEDHAALTQASQPGPVLPIYVAEPEFWQQSDASARQWAFVSECLAELRETFADLGQPLIVRVGDIIDVLADLSSEFKIAAVYSHQETGNGWTYDRDKRVAAWLSERSIPWREPRQSGTIRRLKTRDGWAKKWDKFMSGNTLPAPRLTPLHDIALGTIPSFSELRLKPDPCAGRQAGGRTAGLERLTSFLESRGETYRKSMSAPGPGAEHCSRLSPHLAWGTLSMREVTQATWKRQRDLKLASKPTGSWRGSMTSFSGRLRWRDHFIQKLEDEPRLEFNNLHPAYDGLRPEEPNQTKLKAWAAGETGLPFMDACMRCLNQTGWMNFRMRAMLLATASYHLWLPWQASGEHLARQFTDYEPGIHWPQVQMQSGTTGINTIRIYNPVKQGYDQDPDGAFTRRWVPELNGVPDRYLHEPWKWDAADTVLDKAYPRPLIDPVASAREAKNKVYAVRKRPDFRKDSDRIQKKHGSRKSGLPMTGRKKRKSVPKEQLALDLKDQ